MEYVQQFDLVPQFWQYLRGLEPDDLINELIQNELDAGSTNTQITFGESRLTCKGNGASVDKDGWARLSFLMGAGDRVPRKQYQLGIKNHGLKTCFTIGNEIIIQSDRKCARQTLFKDGIDKLPSPGAYRYPTLDNTAPGIGCIIEIPYRDKRIIVDIGEPFEFSVLSDVKLQQLFLNACSNVAEYIIGVLRPNLRKSYLIEITHFRLGTARFQFSAGREKLIDNGIQAYHRICRKSGIGEDWELHETCCLFTVPFPSGSNKEIPDFFKATKRSFFSEISWKTDGHGRPSPKCGRCRYPLGFVGDSSAAHSGVGVNFSGPYISDPQRHGRTANTDFNDLIDEACKTVLVKVLRNELIPKYGPKVLELLVDPDHHDENTLRQMVEKMLDQRAVPIRPALKNAKNAEGENQFPNKGERTISFGPQNKRGTVHPVILPVFSWEPGIISPLLVSICPKDKDQIDPSIPKKILKLLSTKECKGWGENHYTFDEFDAFDRIQPKKSSYFPWANEKSWKAALGNPKIAKLYLDVIMRAYESGRDIKQDELDTKGVVLPDNALRATELPRLFSGYKLPSSLRIVSIPPLIHPDIAQHRIFRKKRWTLRQFTLSEYLDRANIHKADARIRKQFYEWVLANPKYLKGLWNQIIELPIWPDRKGLLLPLSSFCMPRSSKIAAILNETLTLPRPDLAKFFKRKHAIGMLISIRSKPSEDELAAYISQHISQFPTDVPLNKGQKIKFQIFEEHIAEICKDHNLCNYVKKFGGLALGLNAKGYLRKIEELVRVETDNKRLHLLLEDIIDRRSRSLDNVDGWAPQKLPSSDQILRALKHDGKRIEVHLPRLLAFTKAAEREGKHFLTNEIGNVKCIPFEGQLYAPNDLSFTSNRGDFWGTWKKHISGKGLSSDAQAVYKAVGVLVRQPTPETSLEFFQWLSVQDPKTVLQNLDCIIRHINHRDGPRSWCEENPEVPFIPVDNLNGEVMLLTLAEATGKKALVFIADFKELEDAIRSSVESPDIKLAITTHPNVSEPITSFLTEIGVKLLHEMARVPIKVEAEEPNSAPLRITELLEKLRSPRMAKELRKRLDILQLPNEKCQLLVRWQDQLTNVKEIYLAKSLAVTFKIARRSFNTLLESTFEFNSGIIWVTSSQPERLFYKVIAEIIFNNPPPFLWLVLREAISVEFSERFFPKDQLIEMTDGDPDSDWEDDFDDGEPGITDQTHKKPPPDPIQNIPEPDAIPKSVSRTDRRKTTSSGKNAEKSNTDTASAGRGKSEIEEIQIENLKQKQYACHCQICLAEKPPDLLSPADSYTWIYENRRRIMRAHHPDQVHARGARHAGNILILCNAHHYSLGDAMSRQEITDALKDASASSHEIRFTTTMSGETVQRTIIGRLAEITLSLSEKPVKIFFTQQHADYWIAKASPKGSPKANGEIGCRRESH